MPKRNWLPNSPRQAMKDCGIGTPATRASIIETLFKRGYMERCKKSLVPTEKGLALNSVVKTMRIADVAMTGEWEKELARIERGELFHISLTELVTLDYPGHDVLKLVAWGNGRQGGQTLPTLRQGDHLETAFAPSSHLTMAVLSESSASPVSN